MTATDSHQWVLPTVVEFPPLEEIDLPLPLRAMLRRRGFDHSAVVDLLEPRDLPDPCDDFPDLEQAVQRVCEACAKQEALAVCGDYDADGMTSTALLLRAFQPLGAKATAAIPSRMDEGYGLNTAMVDRLHGQGIRLLVTGRIDKLGGAYLIGTELVNKAVQSISRNLGRSPPAGTPVALPAKSL